MSYRTAGAPRGGRGAELKLSWAGAQPVLRAGRAGASLSCGQEGFEQNGWGFVRPGGRLWRDILAVWMICTALRCVFQRPAQPGRRRVVGAAHRGRLGLQCRLLCVSGSRPPDLVRGDPKPAEGQGGRQQVPRALALLAVLPVGRGLSMGSLAKNSPPTS